MENKQKKTIENILKNYQGKEVTKFDQLKELDKKVKKPANIFGYVYGTIGALILGMGMCAAMNTLPEFVLNAIKNPLLMILGIIIGLVGIAMTTSTYFIYNKILKSRRNKYANEIISLIEELLNKKEGE